MAPDQRRLSSAGATATITAAAAASLVSSSATTTAEKGADEHVVDPSNDSLLLLRRQLALLLLLRCLRTAHLAQPILVPYYTSPASEGGVGLSPPSVLWLGSLYSALVTAVELPSGFASDFLGRRTTLHLAFLGLGSSLLVSSVASSSSMGRGGLLAALAASQFLRAVGSALFSGTDMALLYETLRRHHQRRRSKAVAAGNGKAQPADDTDERVLDIESRHVFFTTATEAAFAALGGVASEACGLRATVAASAVPFLAGAGVCLLLEDDSPRRRRRLRSVASPRPPSRVGKGEGGESSPDCTDVVAKDDEAAPLTHVIPKKTSNLILPDVPADNAASSGTEGRAEDPSSSVSQSASEEGANGVTPSSPPSPFALLLHVPPRLRTVFLVGVALNCGTYVASTALNPLLWSSAGLHTVHFGWIGAANGCASAVGALLAPPLRRLVAGRGRASIRSDGRVGGGGGGGTEGLLLLLLAASAVAYGTMATSARLSLTPASSSARRDRFTRAAAVVGAVGASVLLSVVRGLAWPVLGSAVNAAVDDDGSRATTLSAFAGAVKLGMIGTGFVLGLILGEAGEESSSRGGGADGGEVGATLGAHVPGLFEGCALCGLTLASVGAWLARSGLAQHSVAKKEEAVEYSHRGKQKTG